MMSLASMTMLNTSRTPKEKSTKRPPADSAGHKKKLKTTLKFVFVSARDLSAISTSTA